MPESPWGSIEEAARYLGVSNRTIRRRITDGTIKAQKFGPRLIRVDMTSIDENGRPLAWSAA